MNNQFTLSLFSSGLFLIERYKSYHPATKPLSDGLVKLPVMDDEIVGFEPEEG